MLVLSTSKPQPLHFDWFDWYLFTQYWFIFWLNIAYIQSKKTYNRVWKSYNLGFWQSIQAKCTKTIASGNFCCGSDYFVLALYPVNITTTLFCYFVYFYEIVFSQAWMMLYPQRLPIYLELNRYTFSIDRNGWCVSK